MFSKIANVAGRAASRQVLARSVRVPSTPVCHAVTARHFQSSRADGASQTPKAEAAVTPSPTAEAPSTGALTGEIGGEIKFNPAMFNVGVPDASVDVMPLSGAVGAEIRGIDLSRQLTDEDKERILGAYFRYGAVFFRNQDLTQAEHYRLACEFGTPEPHPIVAGVDGFPDIVRIVKDAGTVTKFGETWHSDNSFMHEPSVGSLLVARELPPYGNDTLWASMYAVYESLSPGLKTMLDSMVGIHSAAYAFNPNEGSRSDNYGGKKEMKYEMHPILEQDVEHPVVITHPVTGRKALFVNSMFTVRFKGMTQKESRPLLEYLFSVVERPEFQCRFQWAPGSVAFWDNRATQHMAVGDETRFRRVMERITLKGCAPSQ